jgi:hypothetical protein
MRPLCQDEVIDCVMVAEEDVAPPALHVVGSNSGARLGAVRYPFYWFRSYYTFRSVSERTPSEVEIPPTADLALAWLCVHFN